MIWLRFKINSLLIYCALLSLPVFSFLISAEWKFCCPLPSSPSTLLPSLLPLFSVDKTIPADSYVRKNSLTNLKNYVISYTTKKAFESQITSFWQTCISNISKPCPQASQNISNCYVVMSKNFVCFGVSASQIHLNYYLKKLST